MASIIEFRKPLFEAKANPGRAPVTASADIVLFPGVRYERYADEPPPAKQRGRRSRRRRDQLDLDD